MEPHRTGRNEPHATLIEPGRTLGPYLVLSTLSSGARSIVYMAQDLSLDRPVALKTAPRGAISVIAEGRVLARFSHPNIVTLHGLWSEPPVLILEYLVGETLKARRERVGPLPEPHVQKWMQEALSALEAAHGQGLAHGAIRADNVFLTTDQRVKLLDFRQTSLGESPPMPADDVRAVGRLMQELLGAETGPLADIARGALLGRYATARALRMALTASLAPASVAASTAEVEAPAPVNLAPPQAPSTEESGDRPKTETWVGEDLALAAAELSDLFEEPSINPMLPAFNERPGWGRPISGRARAGIVLVLIMALTLLGLKLAWPHRREALNPVAHIAHEATHMAHGVMRAPGKHPRASTVRATPKRKAHPKTANVVVRPGAYAALAHAWGG